MPAPERGQQRSHSAASEPLYHVLVASFGMTRRNQVQSRNLRLSNDVTRPFVPIQDLLETVCGMDAKVFRHPNDQLQVTDASKGDTMSL